MFQMKQTWLQQKINNIITTSENALSFTQKPCIICNKTHHTSTHPAQLGQPARPAQLAPSIRLPSTLQICHACQQDIPWIQHVHCDTCGRFETCHDCKRRKQTYFVSNRSAVRYDDTMKAWLGQYKYRKNERHAQLFVAMLMPTFQNFIRTLASQQQTIHCITFIPLSEERMEERGFNQAEILAQGLANMSQLPIIPLLTRTRHTHKQSYKSRIERLEDLEGVFLFDQAALSKHPLTHLDHGAAHQAPYFNILLVDDVYTTGSTLNQCAKMINSALPAQVYGLTWAR